MVKPFSEHGGNSDYLNHIAQVLNALHQEHQTINQFFERLLSVIYSKRLALNMLKKMVKRSL